MSNRPERTDPYRRGNLVADYAVDTAIEPYPRANLDRQGPVGRVPGNVTSKFTGLSRGEAEAIAAEREAEFLRRLPQAVSNPGDYADAAVISATFLLAQNQLVLERPRGTRIYLLIQNQLPNLAANNIVVNFGAPARVTNGVLIPPGGNWLWDSRVAQNDVHVWAPAAGIVTVCYLNTNLNTVAP